jgi:hypothetical protein
MLPDHFFVISDRGNSDDRRWTTGSAEAEA